MAQVSRVGIPENSQPALLVNWHILIFLPYDMGQQMYLTGLCAALVVPLHERHDQGGPGWLDIMEEVQQNDDHERDS
jgi:hypothetical protein